MKTHIQQREEAITVGARELNASTATAPLGGATWRKYKIMTGRFGL